MKFRSALVYGKLINLAINVIDKSRGSNKAGEMAMAKCPDMMKHFKGIDPSKVLVAGRAAQVQHAPRREVRPVGPTCRAERKGGEAQGS